MKRAVCVVALLFSASGGAGQESGSARVVPIQVSGDAAQRFSLVILGDGYTTAEVGRFREHVNRHLNVLWSLEPFRSYRNYINVYAVEIASAESGITCDPAHRQRRQTPLGLHFSGGCDDANARGILVDQEAARRYARLATPDFDQILTMANTDTYGGIGGGTATTSGGNALGPYITPHELGHSLGRLQDEYTYSRRGVAGDAYTGEEPVSIHHTLLTEAQMRTEQRKWWRWLGEPSESGGTIGRYEGGQSRASGIWRPSRHSMMISLGYYFDQVSLERMTQRISSQVELIAAGTAAMAAVPPTAVLWIEPARPVYHELGIRWQVDGRPVPQADDQPHLALGPLGLTGAHRVSVTVIDPTPFVRDPAIRDTSFTATRSWTVRTDAVPMRGDERAAFTASTDTARAVSGQEVVHVETTHPADRVLEVTWRLDGVELAGARGRRSLALARQNLESGRHLLEARVTDPAQPAAAGETRRWTVDNTGPVVTYVLAEPVASVEAADGSRHSYFHDRFTLKLEPADDQPGYVVAEFRVNRDGWHHYYGWPDAPPGTPFLFTPRGTTIKELIYGSLSAEGLSPQPWEPREPGWGTHRIEYRGRDAAGNLGDTQEFHVTVQPAPVCTATVRGTHVGDLPVRSGVTCLESATVTGSVTVAAGASLSALNSVVRGPLIATGAATLELAGTGVGGAVLIEGATDRLVVFGSTFEQDVTLASNRTATPPILAGNRLAAGLHCDGNTASLERTGAPNRVAGQATGQCAPAPGPESNGGGGRNVMN